MVLTYIFIKKKKKNFRYLIVNYKININFIHFKKKFKKNDRLVLFL